MRTDPHLGTLLVRVGEATQRLARASSTYGAAAKPLTAFTATISEVEKIMPTIELIRLRIEMCIDPPMDPVQILAIEAQDPRLGRSGVSGRKHERAVPSAVAYQNAPTEAVAAKEWRGIRSTVYVDAANWQQVRGGMRMCYQDARATDGRRLD